MHFTLGELLLDLVQNAASAGSRTVRVRWRRADGALELLVDDDGPGMPPEIVARATDPFYTDGIAHPTRTVGLGLAFLRQTAEATGGRFVLDSRRDGTPARGRGTSVGLYAPASHIDLPPDGEVVATLVLVLCTEGPEEIEVVRQSDHGSYRVTKRELQDVLGDLSSVESRGLLREYLESQEDELWPR
ncbi:MAG: sensor histidine kinase [Spirochaetota bacterium]